MVFSEQLIQFILTAFIRVLTSIPISARGKSFGNGPSKAFGLPDLALCWCDGSGCCRCPGWSCLGRLGYGQPFYVIHQDISNHVMRIYVYTGIYIYIYILGYIELQPIGKSQRHALIWENIWIVIGATKTIGLLVEKSSRL